MPSRPNCLPCMCESVRVFPHHVQDGVTALMRAVQGGHTDVVRLLLEEGAADPNLQTNAGGTALMHASFKGTTYFLHSSVNLSSEHCLSSFKIAPWGVHPSCLLLPLERHGGANCLKRIRVRNIPTRNCKERESTVARQYCTNIELTPERAAFFPPLVVSFPFSFLIQNLACAIALYSPCHPLSSYRTCRYSAYPTALQSQSASPR
jgi:hypothetical protein